MRVSCRLTRNQYERRYEMSELVAQHEAGNKLNVKSLIYFLKLSIICDAIFRSWRSEIDQIEHSYSREEPKKQITDLMSYLSGSGTKDWPSNTTCNQVSARCPYKQQHLPLVNSLSRYSLLVLSPNKNTFRWIRKLAHEEARDEMIVGPRHLGTSAHHTGVASSCIRLVAIGAIRRLLI